MRRQIFWFRSGPSYFVGENKVHPHLPGGTTLLHHKQQPLVYFPTASALSTRPTKDREYTNYVPVGYVRHTRRRRRPQGTICRHLTVQFHFLFAPARGCVRAPMHIRTADCIRLSHYWRLSRSSSKKPFASLRVAWLGPRPFSTIR